MNCSLERLPITEAPNGYTANPDFVREQTISSALTDSNTVLPPQFTKTFLRNGGKMRVSLGPDMQIHAYGYQFSQPKGDITRWYPLIDTFQLPGEEGNYDVSKKGKEHHRGQIVASISGFDIVRPSSGDIKEIALIQQKAMGYKADLTYPTDLWLPEAGPATQLAVRSKQNGILVGFLLGFYARNEDGHVWIESQLMGVAPEVQGKGIGRALKLQQRKEALENGITRIRWTVDPLKNANAILNLNKLGGVVQKFLPDHYQFGNMETDALPASRVQIDWELTTDNVEQSITGRRHIPTLEKFVATDKNAVLVNPLISSDEIFHDSKTYLIQIPENWTFLQKNDPDLAKKWRETSDTVFAQLLNGSHIIKMVVDGKKPSEHYLVVEPDPYYYGNMIYNYYV